LTVKEYADKHQLSIETVRRYIRSGKLSANLSEGKYIINDNNRTTTGQQQDNNNTTGINENIQEPKRDMPETFANESAMNLLAEQLQEANNQIKTKDTQIEKLQQALDQHFTRSAKTPLKPNDFS
jgi:hypothetical protein